MLQHLRMYGIYVSMLADVLLSTYARARTHTHARTHARVHTTTKQQQQQQAQVNKIIIFSPEHHVFE